MDLHVRSTPVGSHKDQALLLLLAPGDDPGRALDAAGTSYREAYEALVERGAFEAKPGQCRVLTGAAKDGHPILVVVGTGKLADAQPMRSAASTGLRALRDLGVRSATVLLPTGRGPLYRPDHVADAVAEGAVTGLYRFQVHKSKKAKTRIETLTLLAPRGEAKRAEKGARRGRILGEAVCLARDLGNEPGNRATPTYLAETAMEIAGEHGLEVKILEEADMEKLGMGALLGVSQGSAEPAKLILLTYEPARASKSTETVALVGKGLTFDAGGISIKPAAKMDEMRFDMCGGAAVLATMQAVARLKVPVRVIGVVPSSENLLGAKAYKPGDIVRAMNGTTIEVKNTDAEGRLILADALSYVTSKVRPRPKIVIDLATLTGACVVSLGDQHCGLISNDDALATKMLAAGERSGDRAWRLPLTDGYRKQIDSPYADIQNLGTGPGAGTITAGAFLERFIGKSRWAHLDIAGTAWTDKQAGLLTKGATGFGVRLLADLLSGWRRG